VIAVAPQINYRHATSAGRIIFTSISCWSNSPKPSPVNANRDLRSADRLLNDSQPVNLIFSERCAAAMHFNVLGTQMEHMWWKLGLLASMETLTHLGDIAYRCPHRVNNVANTLAAMAGVFMKWLTFAGRQPVCRTVNNFFRQKPDRNA
jgi:hypothetical protein